MGPGGGFHPGQYGPRVTTAQPGTREHYARYGTFGSTRGESSSYGMPGSREYYARHGTFGDPTRPSDPVANPHLRGNTYNLQFDEPVAAEPAVGRFGSPVNVNTLFQSDLQGLLAALTRGTQAAQQNAQNAPQREAFSPEIQAIRDQYLQSLL
jgi:hypothetical protein